MTENVYPKQYLFRRIVQAKLFIDNNFAEQLDLNNIADEAHFSKFHFIRLFKKSYGYTPHQYLIQVRIENAKMLLEKNTTTVTDVCYSVGFESINSFTTLFKKRVGLPPADYQLQRKKMKSAIAESPLAFIPHCFAEKKGWNEKSNFE